MGGWRIVLVIALFYSVIICILAFCILKMTQFQKYYSRFNMATPYNGE